MTELKTILLVEDEVLIGTNEAKLLRKEGYEVLLAASGEEAIAQATSGSQEIALILMDIDLGRDQMDGTQAAQEILKTHDIPILFLSSHTEPEVVAKTEKITSYGYVAKNTGITVLAASIKMAFKLHTAHQAIQRANEKLEQEIAERKQAENQRREQEHLSQMLLDALPCVALLLRTETREILAINRAAKEAGCQVGDTCYGSWPKFKKPCPWCQAPELWANRAEQHIEVDALGVVWDAYWVPISEDIYMHYAFDITTRKQAEETLQQNAAELRTRNEQLERWRSVTVDRELRMAELKKEVNELCRRLEEPLKYEDVVI